MTMNPVRPLRLGLLGLLFPLILLACSGGDTAAEHVVLEGSLDRLRSDFDAEAGKVRAIFLASPT